MTQQEKDVKQYLREIEKLLFGSKKTRKRFLTEYEDTIYESIEETGQTYSYKQLVDRFGAPTVVVENYASEFASDATKAIKQKKLKKRAIFLICFLIVIICLVFVCFSMQKATHYYMGHYTDSAYRS